MADVAELMRLLAAVPEPARQDALVGLGAALDAYLVTGDEQLLERSAEVLVAALRRVAQGCLAEPQVAGGAVLATSPGLIG